MADFNKDDHFKLIQIQTVTLLLQAFSSSSNIATETPAAKNIHRSSSPDGSQKDAISTIYPPVKPYLPIYETAHAELLYACC